MIGAPLKQELCSTTRFSQRCEGVMTEKIQLKVVAYVIDLTADLNEVKERIGSFLKMEAYVAIGCLSGDQLRDRLLRSYCLSIDIDLLQENDNWKGERQSFLPLQCDFHIRLIVLHDGPVIDSDEDEDSEDEDSDCPAYRSFLLPNRSFMVRRLIIMTIHHDSRIRSGPFRKFAFRQCSEEFFNEFCINWAALRSNERRQHINQLESPHIDGWPSWHRKSKRSYIYCEGYLLLFKLLTTFCFDLDNTSEGPCAGACPGARCSNAVSRSLRLFV